MMEKAAPARGFAAGEFARRIAGAQAELARNNLDGLLLTTPAEFYYFTGFLTRFWESPTRPWFLIIPQSGEPVAVIPTIGAPLMRRTAVRDIRTWSSPDLKDDGVSLLADTLSELFKDGRVGTPDGIETHVRMPLADFQRLTQMVGPVRIEGDCGIVANLRMVKSQAEIEKIENACGIAERAFANVREFARPGVGFDMVCREFQRACLAQGADWVPYLAGGHGPCGYDDVISPATSAPLQNGDILMLDTGLVWDGYFCDFDRNFSLGPADNETAAAYDVLIEATQAGFEAIRPGQRACDIFAAMDQVLTGGAGTSENGRLGHGLGIQLTEWPSLIPGDTSELKTGMVLTLEPSILTRDGCMLVHEENVVIEETGARYLTKPCPKGLPVLDQAI